jgi:hypothetical protein
MDIFAYHHVDRVVHLGDIHLDSQPMGIHRDNLLVNKHQAGLLGDTHPMDNFVEDIHVVGTLVEDILASNLEDILVTSSLVEEDILASILVMDTLVCIHAEGTLLVGIPLRRMFSWQRISSLRKLIFSFYVLELKRNKRKINYIVFSC